MEYPKAYMNSKHHTMEFVDKLPEEMEEKMRKDFVEYESSHEISKNLRLYSETNKKM